MEATTGDTRRSGGPGAHTDRARPVAILLLEVRPEAALWTLPEGGPTVLRRLCETLALPRRVRELALVLPERDADPELLAEAQRLNVRCILGAGPDALAHTVQALRALVAEPEQPVLRVTTASPLLCPEVVDDALEALEAGGHEYVSTDLGSGVLPPGQDVEATYARLLYDLDARLSRESDRQRVTFCLYRPGTRCRVHELSPVELGPALERSGRYYASFDLSLRGAERRAVLGQVAALLDRQPEPRALPTLLSLLDQHPEWRQRSARILR